MVTLPLPQVQSGAPLPECIGAGTLARNLAGHGQNCSSTRQDAVNSRFQGSDFTANHMAKSMKATPMIGAYWRGEARCLCARPTLSRSQRRSIKSPTTVLNMSNSPPKPCMPLFVYSVRATDHTNICSSLVCGTLRSTEKKTEQHVEEHQREDVVLVCSCGSVQSDLVLIVLRIENCSFVNWVVSAGRHWLRFSFSARNNEGCGNDGLREGQRKT